MLDRLKREIRKLTSKIAKVELSEGNLSPILSDFKISLIASDVALSVADEICDRVKEKLIGMKVGRFENKGEAVRKALREVILGILKAGGDIDVLELVKSKKKEKSPAVFVFVGFNGTGKTTTIAKVARFLMKNGYSVVLACSDTRRAGAIEQLEEHAKKLSVTMVKRPYGSDAASVAFDAINHAKARGIDAVLIDTAGRAETDRSLMEQMRKIVRVSSPDLVVFVGDALTGNAAVAQAEEFRKYAGIDSSILTKVDADVKGGAAISIAFITKKPIIFLGTGQRYEDLIPFDPNYIVSILGV